MNPNYFTPKYTSYDPRLNPYFQVTSIKVTNDMEMEDQEVPNTLIVQDPDRNIGSFDMGFFENANEFKIGQKVRFKENAVDVINNRKEHDFKITANWDYTIVELKYIDESEVEPIPASLIILDEEYSTMDSFEISFFQYINDPKEGDYVKFLPASVIDLNTKNESDIKPVLNKSYKIFEVVYKESSDED